MPIFPTYQPQRIDVATPNTPLPDGQSPRAELLQQGGQAIQKASLIGREVARKRRELKDDTLVLKRYMQAVEEMEAEKEGFVHGGDTALNARERMDGVISKRSPEWHKGLSPEASLKLEQKLFGKTLEYRGVASRVEHRALADDFTATLGQAARNIVKETNRRGIVGDVEDSTLYQAAKEAVEGAVAKGLIDRKDADKELKTIRESATYAGAYRMVVDTPELFNELYQSEMKARADSPSGEGSGPLRHLSQQVLTQLHEAAVNRERTIKRDAEHAADRIYTERERKLKKDRELVEAEIDRRLRGDPGTAPLTVTDLDKWNAMGLVDGEKYKFVRDAMTNNLIQGSPAHLDTELLRDVGLRVASMDTLTRNNPEVRKLKADIRQYVKEQRIPFQTGLQWLGQLTEKDDDGAGDPKMRQQHQDVKHLIENKLRTTGSLSFDRIANGVKAEFYEIMARNAARGFPIPPMELYDQHVDKMLARTRLGASYRVQELRMSEKLPAASDDKGSEAVRRRVTEVFSEYNTLPEGHPRKAELFLRLERLKEIMDVEREAANLRPDDTATSQKSAPASQQPSGPLQGPRTGR